MRILWTKDIVKNLKPETSVKLSVIGKGVELKMYVNDQLIAAESNALLTQGNPGVFAYSKGCFEFDEFSLFERVK